MKFVRLVAEHDHSFSCMAEAEAGRMLSIRVQSVIWVIRLLIMTQADDLSCMHNAEVVEV